MNNNKVNDKADDYRNIERARRTIVNQMARNLHFAGQDLKAMSEAIVKRDAAQREIREIANAVAQKTLEQLR